MLIWAKIYECNPNIHPKDLTRLNKFRKYLIFGVILAAGCSSTPSSPLTMGPGGPISIVGPGGSANNYGIVHHKVGPSETLWRISKTYGVDMQTILNANHLSDPNMIKNGQTLIIPNAKSPKPVIPLYPSHRWTHIVVHHTATHQGDAFSIDQLHHKRGFDNGLGYHFLINNGTNGKADGQIQIGPRWVKQQNGAHANANGMNDRGIGIALVGNYSEKRLSAAEFQSLLFLVRTLQEYYGIPSANIIRHGDVPGKNTECPGLNFPWAEFKSNLR